MTMSGPLFAAAAAAAAATPSRTRCLPLPVLLLLAAALVAIRLPTCCGSFVLLRPLLRRRQQRQSSRSCGTLLLNRLHHHDAGGDGGVGTPPPTNLLSRREAAVAAAVSAAAFFASGGGTAAAFAAEGSATDGDKGSSMYAPKFVQEYDDFVRTDEGWSYRDVNPGATKLTGDAARVGDRIVFEYSGYTIGYFGRPFQAKGGPQGGAFDKDIDYARTVIGSGSIVKGLEQSLVGMRAGMVRQVVVPYGPLSYPPTSDGDGNHDRVGPKPSTFSGLRALNFVLDNPRIDRTLLFNVKVVRVDRPDGRGGFVRGDK